MVFHIIEMTMEYEKSREYTIDPDMIKFRLLAEIFRIASQGDQITSSRSDLLPLGHQGAGFGPAEEILCVVNLNIDYKGTNLYSESDSFHVASLQIKGDVYQFYAILDRKAMAYYVYDTDSLQEALYELSSIAEYSPYPGELLIEDAVGYEPSFKTQQLKIYKNLPTISRLKEEGYSERDEYLEKIVAAIDVHDTDTARKLMLDIPDDKEIDLEKLSALERSYAAEVSSEEIAALQKMLAQEYFAAA